MRRRRYTHGDRMAIAGLCSSAIPICILPAHDAIKPHRASICNVGADVEPTPGQENHPIPSPHQIQNECDARLQTVQERRDLDFRHQVDASHSQRQVRSRGARPQGCRGSRRMECGPVRSIKYPSYMKLLNRLTDLHRNRLHMPGAVLQGHAWYRSGALQRQWCRHARSDRLINLGPGAGVACCTPGGLTRIAGSRTAAYLMDHFGDSRCATAVAAYDREGNAHHGDAHPPNGLTMPSSR